MTRNELNSTDSPPIFAPICADIARARDEVKRAAKRCTPEKCVCREARRELMLRALVLRMVQELQREEIEPEDVLVVGRIMLRNYKNIQEFVRKERRDLARQRERMRTRGLSEQQIAANPPRTRRQKAAAKRRSLVTQSRLYSGLDPWEGRGWPRRAPS